MWGLQKLPCQYFVITSHEFAHVVFALQKGVYRNDVVTTIFVMSKYCDLETFLRNYLHCIMYISFVYLVTQKLFKYKDLKQCMIVRAVCDSLDNRSVIDLLYKNNDHICPLLFHMF